MKKENINYKAGFTLLELLVVVVIIGILAAIALPQYRMSVAKSELASLKSLTKSIYESEMRYYILNGELGPFSGLDVMPPSGTCSDSLTSSRCYGDWGNCYIYLSTRTMECYSKQDLQFNIVFYNGSSIYGIQRCVAKKDTIALMKTNWWPFAKLMAPLPATKRLRHVKSANGLTKVSKSSARRFARN